MGGIIKHLAEDLPNESIVFFRNVLALIILIPLIAFSDGWSGFKTTQLRFHLMRGAIGVTAMSCFFYILGNMHFTEAILLKLTTPFFIPLIALLWLKESSSKNTLLAIAVGFIGVIFIIDPIHKGLSALNLVAVGLTGAVLAALAKVTIRRMGINEPSTRIVFYFSVFASVLSLPFAINAWIPPSIEQYGLLFVLAVVATIGQLLVTSAYRRAPAGKIGQFTYTSVLFSSLLGWLFWDEAITLSIALGCLFIVSAGILNIKSK